MIFVYYAVILIIILAFIALLVGMFLTMLYLLPMAKGAVYVPSTPAAIDAMIELTKAKPGMKIADLGSGDGRVVVELAKTGATVDGYEINPLLVWKARRKIAEAQVKNRAAIIPKSYWNVDLSKYDAVTVYGITYIMKDLSRKLRSELHPGAVVASNYFQLPDWKKLKTQAGVHLYRQKSRSVQT